MNQQGPWQAQTELLDGGRIRRSKITKGGKSISFAEALELWRDEFLFRTYFSELLAKSPFPAFRWETPGMTSETIKQDFEFVLLRCESLDRPVDRYAFESHFDCDTDVVTFPNLGADAILIVPCPSGKESIYGHLASVLRKAPDSQVHNLWCEVAAVMSQRLSNRPVWLSTAGMGVAWLHIRLDDRPKYYGYEPYRNA